MIFGSLELYVASSLRLLLVRYAGYDRQRNMNWLAASRSQLGRAWELISEVKFFWPVYNIKNCDDEQRIHRCDKYVEVYNLGDVY